MSVESDFLVIGTGIAGLSSALKLAKHGTVAVITKKKQTEANTTYAQGGIASVFHPQDSYDQHIDDTIQASAGLCKMDAVRMVVERGPALITELDELGVAFTRTPEGQFDLGRDFAADADGN